MIEVSDITKRYGDITAVDNVSFEIDRGEIVGLLGPNGAGKTTAIRAMTGYIHPDNGNVSISGHNIMNEEIEAQKQLGYLPEFSPVYEDMNVLQYLRLIGQTRGMSAQKIEDRIEGVADRCGISNVLDRRIEYLSKGYQQRICLAQALIHNPEFLILDEPTTGLDPNQVIALRDLIREVGQNHTVLLSTHILQEVSAICNRIMVIHKGRIVADGTEDELLQEHQQNQYYLTIRTQNGQSGSDVQNRLQNEELISSVTSETETGDDASESETNSKRFTIEFDETKNSNEKPDEVMTNIIRDEDWILQEFTPDRPSLEEVFVRLTQE